MRHNAENVLVLSVPTAEDQYVVFCRRKDVWGGPAGREQAALHEAAVGRPGLPTVVGLPVAGYQHAAVWHGERSREGAPHGHYAHGGEVVRRGVVDFRPETAAYAESFRAAAAHQDATVRQLRSKAIGVRIDHGQRVPGATRVVFRRLDGLEAIGMAA